MKTPLSSILIGSKVLHSGRIENKPEKKERHFKIIEEESQHLLSLINRLLTISKLESGKLELHRQPVELLPMIEDIAERFKLKASKEVLFNINLQTDNIFADEEYLRETLENLVDNAIKYSKNSGVHIDISSSDKEVGSCTTIHIKDDGLGMTATDQKKIFEKFERASAVGLTRKGGATGFGLGLNYVFQVMKAHGGSVDVNSEKGKYSEFILLFPNEIEEDKIIVT